MTGISGVPIPGGGERRVLLVDRDPAFGDILGNFLGAEYALRHVPAVAEALPLLEEDGVDVVLLNGDPPRGAAAAEPGRDYFQATAHLRLAPSVIAFGWDDRRETAARLLAQGANDYLAQPMGVRELRFAIDRAHRRMKLARELGAARRLLGAEAGGASFHDAVHNFKREMVGAALRRNAFNKLRAARELRISRPYLHRLMHQLEIENPSAEAAPA